VTRLTRRQRGLLAALAAGPRTAYRLSGTQNTAETVAAALKRLAARGLVEPETRPPATWTTKWRLTDAGREAVGK